MILINLNLITAPRQIKQIDINVPIFYFFEQNNTKYKVKLSK